MSTMDALLFVTTAFFAGLMCGVFLRLIAGRG